MRMMDVVRKVEKNAIANLDLLIKVKKEEMMVECSMSQMISRKKEYFKQVEELGFVMDDLFNLRRIDKALVYIDEKS